MTKKLSLIFICKTLTKMLPKYVCPITGEEISQGIILADGIVYEKKTINEYLKVENIVSGAIYPQLTKSPYTGELLPSSRVMDYVFAHRLNNGYSDLFCPITKEAIKIPYVIFSEKRMINTLYEYDALVDYVNNICKKRKDHYFYNYDVADPFHDEIIIVPDKSLMMAMNIPIGKHITQTFQLPKTKIPTSKKIRSITIRKLFRKDTNDFQEKMKDEFKKNSIPIHIYGYMREDVVIMNLDLSNMQIMRGFKGCVFYNCNLSNTIISEGMPRCQFNFCNMNNVTINASSFIGEEVSFFGSTMDNIKIIDSFELEKGTTWVKCANLKEVKKEMLRRGATSVKKMTLLDY